MDFRLVKKMQRKFGISYDGNASTLSREEYLFRIGAITEELLEYVDSVFDVHIDINKVVKMVLDQVSKYELKENPNLEDQMDALLDIIIFTAGAGALQGFNMPVGFERVMKANMNKELASSSSQSKRGFSLDLIKPRGWTPPKFNDLMTRRPTGIIVLDGPDGCGKTTLADYFVEHHGAKYMHLTWSPKLERAMDTYQLHCILDAEKISKDRLVIIDRFWLSELVYSNVYRGGSNWCGLHSTLHHLTQRLGVLNIICLPENGVDYNTHYASLKTRRLEMYDDTIEVYDMYSELWDGTCRAQPSVDVISCGLKYLDSFVRYDFMSEGEHLDTLTKKYLSKLEIIKNEC